MSKRKKEANLYFLKFHRTDAGNAEMFAAMCEQFLRFDHKLERWLHWNGNRWMECRQNQQYQFFKGTVTRRFRLAETMSADDTQRGAEIHWALESESRSRIEAALSLAKAEPLISDSGEGWDADPWQLGVANGAVDLRTGAFRELRREDKITKFCRTAFNPHAKCPRWIKFLGEIFDGNESLIRFVQKAAGYSLAGDVSEHVLFLLYGTGRNGKSTLVETILALLGDYGESFMFSTFADNHRTLGDGVSLYKTRFATSMEAKKKTKLEVGRIKAWTGGDRMTVRPLYKNPVSFDPSHKLWLGVNHKPEIDDETDSIWERIRLIPFNRKFVGDDREKGLKETLRAELPGILNWAIEGCLLWQREGLEPPETVRTATKQYEEESNPLTPFLAECCELGPEYTVGCKELSSAIKAWCGENNSPSISDLGDRLRILGFVSTQAGSDRKRCWKGLRLNDLGGANIRTSANTDSCNFSDSARGGKVIENDVRQCSNVRPSNGLTQAFAEMAVLDPAEVCHD